VVWGNHILHSQFALEFGGDGSDAHSHCSGERTVLLTIQRLATEHALLEHGRIVECDPNLVARRADHTGVIHFHRGSPFIH
jgi:hypothetical protein